MSTKNETEIEEIEADFQEIQKKFIHSIALEIEDNQKAASVQNVLYKDPQEFKATKTNSNISGLPPILQNLCTLVVKIILASNQNGDQSGIGSGVVIRQDEVSFWILTCHHVVEGYFDYEEQIKVVFNAIGNYSVQVEGECIYDVASINLLYPSSDPLQCNIKAGPDADFAILKCLKDQTKVTINGAVSIPPQIPDFEKETVYYIGYRNGSNLKWSSDYPVIRQEASEKTLHMDSIMTTPNKVRTVETVLDTPDGKLVKTSDRNYLAPNTISSPADPTLLHVTKTGKQNPCSTQHHIISKYIQDDFMLTTLDTDTGCSGGGYFMSDGSFLALHIGKIKNDWKDLLLPAKNFELHLSLFPQVEFVHKDLFKYLDLEMKSQKDKKNSKPPEFKLLLILQEANYLVDPSVILCYDEGNTLIGRLITKKESDTNEYGSLSQCYQKLFLSSQEVLVLIPILTIDNRIIIEMTPSSAASKDLFLGVNNFKNRIWKKPPPSVKSPPNLCPPHLFTVDLVTGVFLPSSRQDETLASSLASRFREKGTNGSFPSKAFSGYFYHHLTIDGEITYFFAYHNHNHNPNPEFLFVFGIGEHLGSRHYKIPMDNREKMVQHTKDIQDSLGKCFYQSRNQNVELREWIVDFR